MRYFVFLLLYAACQVSPGPATPPKTRILVQTDPAQGELSVYPSRAALKNGHPIVPVSFIASDTKHLEGFAPAATIRLRFEGPAIRTDALPEYFAAWETAPVKVWVRLSAGASPVLAAYQSRFSERENALVIQLQQGAPSGGLVTVEVSAEWRNIRGGAVVFDSTFLQSGAADEGATNSFSYPVAPLEQMYVQAYNAAVGVASFDAPLVTFMPPALESGAPVTALAQRLPSFGWNLEPGTNNASLAHIGAVIYGSVTLGAVRNLSGGFPDWPPSSVSTEEVPFLLTLPEASRLPANAQAFPLVIFGHGYTACKETLFGVASVFAEHGLAVLGIDAVGHGARGSNVQCGIVIPTNFGLDTSSIEASYVDSINQTRQLIGLLGEIAAKIDIMPADGKPDFLVEDVGYMGQSMGGINGGVLSALEPRISATVLNVPLGNLGSALYSRPDARDGPGAAIGFGGNESTVLALESASAMYDPLNFSRTLQERRVLIQQAENDELLPGVGTEWLGMALDAVQETGAPRFIPGAPAQEFPVALHRGEHARAVFAGADHVFLLRPQGGNPQATERAKVQAAHFLRSALLDDVGEVLPAK